jgi:hypothetical protein
MNYQNNIGNNLSARLKQLEDAVATLKAYENDSVGGRALLLKSLWAMYEYDVAYNDGDREDTRITLEMIMSLSFRYN